MHFRNCSFKRPFHIDKLWTFVMVLWMCRKVFRNRCCTQDFLFLFRWKEEIFQICSVSWHFNTNFETHPSFKNLFEIACNSLCNGLVNFTLFHICKFHVYLCVRVTLWMYLIILFVVHEKLKFETTFAILCYSHDDIHNVMVNQRQCCFQISRLHFSIFKWFPWDIQALCLMAYISIF